MAKLMTNIQQLGRTLMLPIAVLPVAAILLRLGQPDMLNIPFISAAGDAIFANLGMLFALGIAVGFAKENHGAAGLAGLVGYLVAVNGAQTLVNVSPEVLAVVSEEYRSMYEANAKIKEIKALRVPIGIISGIIAGILYNRYNNIKLPEFLAFFGGRRFVPIAAGLTGVFVAAIFGYGFPYISSALDTFSQGVVEAGGAGLFVFGLLNRILIVTGLHHILNNVAWFIVGDFNGATGDLNRFFAGDPTAGAFMSGFFPVMMFGLPAACYAMYKSALPQRRKEVGGMYLSLGLTSFLTGVTEPIEFTFMFLAPVLYGIHAVLTGISMALMDFLQIKLGFGFSAGFVDYFLNFGLATKPLLLLPVGAVYAVIYYSVFRFFIVKFNLSVPGREEKTISAHGDVAKLDENSKAHAYIKALGGAANLTSVAACTTRLRLDVVDNKIIDEALLKDLGARGVIRPSATTLQVVVGPTAELVSDDIKQALASSVTPQPISVVSTPLVANTIDDVVLSSTTVSAILKALGGAKNISTLNVVSGRLVMHLKSRAGINENALEALGSRGLVHADDGKTHLLYGPESHGLEGALQTLLRLPQECCFAWIVI